MGWLPPTNHLATAAWWSKYPHQPPRQLTDCSKYMCTDENAASSAPLDWRRSARGWLGARFREYAQPGRSAAYQGIQDLFAPGVSPRTPMTDDVMPVAIF